MLIVICSTKHDFYAQLYYFKKVHHRRSFLYVPLDMIFIHKYIISKN